MNILLVITGLGMGGAETQTVSLADQFAARGHNVTIAYILKPAIVLPRSEKVKVFWLEGEKSAFSMAKAYVNLAKIINQFKPDVVHSHMFHANILSRLARLISRVPRLICTAHNTNEGGKLRMLAYRVTHALGDEFTNVSQEAVEAFEHKKAAPVGHMLSTHNGIDTQRLSFNPVARQQLRSELDIQQSKVFIAIGRFHEQKDYPNLLDAFSKFCRGQSSSHLLIVGDGELRPQIEQQIKNLGLQDKVSLLGIRKDVPELLSASDIFVLSSAWEGFGLVVAEAMAAERITIATNCGGVAEVMGGYGFLIPPRDSVALADSMQQSVDLSDAAASESGSKSRQHIIEKFGLDSVVDRWLKIYTKDVG